MRTRRNVLSGRVLSLFTGLLFAALVASGFALTPTQSANAAVAATTTVSATTLSAAATAAAAVTHETGPASGSHGAVVRHHAAHLSTPGGTLLPRYAHPPVTESFRHHRKIKWRLHKVYCAQPTLLARIVLWVR